MSLAANSLPTSRPPQNWIISKFWDMVFIIAAPIIALIWALITLRVRDAETVLVIFTIFNVAHHFPTFIRIYGDRDLLRRFRWELLLGPIIPFSLAMVAVYYVIGSSGQQGQNAETISSSMIFLFIVLLIWDPWHFLMQHYGFMRIYDRHNQAPRKIAARMDLTISWTWFICVMVLISEWVPELLYNLQYRHGLALVFWFDGPTFRLLVNATIFVAAVMGLVYVGYLCWCAKKGYYISKAKLWMLAITFGVMYLTYVPNPLMNRIAPGWNFALGFATLGMVHVTQYLAIVWKYNRGLALKNRARTKRFASVFAKGGIVVLAVYVVACLLYGVAVSGNGVTLPFEALNTVSEGHGSNLFQSSVGIWWGGILAAIGFTSTFLHYYYDGFIWKVRHKENQQNLVDEEADKAGPAVSSSWWTGKQTRTPVHVLLRQLLYLGVPMLIVIITHAMTTARQEAEDPYEFLALARKFEQNDRPQEMVQAAEIAVQGFQEQLDLQEQMIELRPHARHYASVAELKYHVVFVKREFLVGHSQYGQTVQEHQQDLRDCIAALDKALKLDGSYGFPVAKPEAREAAIELRDSYRDELKELKPVDETPVSTD